MVRASKGSRRSRARCALLAMCLGAALLPLVPARSAVRECSSFASQAAAQTFFIARGGPDSDPHALDPDNDGLACENNPAPFRGLLTLGGDGQALSGLLTSADENCSTGRVVKVFKVRKGKPAKLIGKAQTDDDGNYSVASEGAKGRFFSKIAKKSPCAAERSRKIRFPDRRLEIAPQGLLLTAAAQTGALQARFVDDRNGTSAPAPEAWFHSSRPEEISVSRNGVVTAEASNGSAQIVATVGGTNSAPVLVVVTPLTEGAVTLADDQIVSGPEPTDPDAEPSFDNTFTAVLRDIAPPAVGALLVSTQTAEIVGRVEAVEDLTGGELRVTLAQVAITEVFPALDIDEKIDLTGSPIVFPTEVTDAFTIVRTGENLTFTPKDPSSVGTVRAAAATGTGTVALGPFECKAETTPNSSSLPVELKFPPAFELNFSPDYEVIHNFANGLERLAVSLQPRFSAKIGITITASVEGKVTCKANLGERHVPLPGPLGILLAGVVEFGIGFEAADKLNIVDAGIEGEFRIKDGAAEAGIVCPPADPEGACQFFGSISGDPELDGSVNAPSLGDVRYEPSLQGFGFADFKLGSRQLRKLRLKALETKIGTKLTGSFATKTSQILATDYASSYKGVVEARAGLGGDATDLTQLLGLTSILSELIKVTSDFAASPTGTLRASKASFLPGEDVTFEAELDHVDFVQGLGPYNVDRVLLVQDFAGTPEIVASKSASRGRTRFSFDITAPHLGKAEEFSLFAITKLLPFDLFALELAQATVVDEATEDFPVSAGAFHTCGVRSDGIVACWGFNNAGQASPPGGTFRQVSGGSLHTCGVRSGDTVACWGSDGFGQASPPGGTFRQVSAGHEHNCGVRSDGTVACWGADFEGQASPPGGTFRQVSAGLAHTCGVRSDGTVACWGRDLDSQASPPGGTFRQVSAGAFHTCGVRSDGAVACWGRDENGQASPPGGTFRQVSADHLYTCGVRSDGTVACWGGDFDGQASPPGGTFRQVSAGDRHTCGVRSDDTVACWGRDVVGEASPPGGTFG